MIGLCGAGRTGLESLFSCGWGRQRPRGSRSLSEETEPGRLANVVSDPDGHSLAQFVWHSLALYWRDGGGGFRSAGRNNHCLYVLI